MHQLPSNKTEFFHFIAYLQFKSIELLSHVYKTFSFHQRKHDKADILHPVNPQMKRFECRTPPVFECVFSFRKSKRSRLFTPLYLKDPHEFFQAHIPFYTTTTRKINWIKKEFVICVYLLTRSGNWRVKEYFKTKQRTPNYTRRTREIFFQDLHLKRSWKTPSLLIKSDRDHCNTCKQGFAIRRKHSSCLV